MNLNIEEIKTGISLLDRQHEKYYKAVENVFALCKQEEVEPAAIQEVLEQVREYAVDNFDTEEYLMILEDYAGYDEHREKHNYFKDRIESFNPATMAKQNEGIKELTKDLSKLLVEWFNTQIKKDDMELANFLNKKEEKRKK